MSRAPRRSPWRRRSTARLGCAQSGIASRGEVGGGERCFGLGKVYTRIARGGGQATKGAKCLQGGARVAGLGLRVGQSEAVFEAIGELGAKGLIGRDGL